MAKGKDKYADRARRDTDPDIRNEQSKEDSEFSQFANPEASGESTVAGEIVQGLSEFADKLEGRVHLPDPPPLTVADVFNMGNGISSERIHEFAGTALTGRETLPLNAKEGTDSLICETHQLLQELIIGGLVSPYASHMQLRINGLLSAIENKYGRGE